MYHIASPAQVFGSLCSQRGTSLEKNNIQLFFSSLPSLRLEILLCNTFTRISHTRVIPIRQFHLNSCFYRWFFSTLALREINVNEKFILFYPKSIDTVYQIGYYVGVRFSTQHNQVLKTNLERGSKIMADPRLTARQVQILKAIVDVEFIAELGGDSTCRCVGLKKVSHLLE